MAAAFDSNARHELLQAPYSINSVNPHEIYILQIKKLSHRGEVTVPRNSVCSQPQGPSTSQGSGWSVLGLPNQTNVNVNLSRGCGVFTDGLQVSTPQSMPPHTRDQGTLTLLVYCEVK